MVPITCAGRKVSDEVHYSVPQLNMMPNGFTRLPKREASVMRVACDAPDSRRQI
jgi:hypothetical protein